MRSRFVQTNHGRWAGSCGIATLVDVATTLGCLDESLGTRALTLGAHLAIPAVVVDVTAGLTELVGANFSLQTVLVRVAQFQAKSVGTLFATSAVGVESTNGHTISTVANLSNRTATCRIANIWNPDATLPGCWDSGKANGTLAKLCLILSSAQGVWTAGATQGTRVLTLVVCADVLSRAILVVGTTSHANSRSTRLAIRTLLGSDTRQLALARLTLFTLLELRAADLWRGVRLVARRTGALVGVVLNSADGPLATHVGLADIHAGVRETIAKLVGRTVVIFNAVDGSAALRVGVSGEQARRTGAFSHVVPCQTDGRRTAFQGRARLDAGPLGATVPAHLVFLALGVVCAALHQGPTSGSAVRGAGESGIAFTKALVIVGDADRMGRTDHSGADVDAGLGAKHPFPAHLGRSALAIARASGNKFAHSRHLVLHVALFAEADGSAIGEGALLGVRTGHDLAGVEAGASAIDVDLAE